MNTARIDIAYRPLRVAWVIHSNDFESFRKVIRLSHTLWGGRFNPIVFADRPDDARSLSEVFRADMLMPLGASLDVTSFAATYPHLPTPYHTDGLFYGDEKHPHAALLDVENALVFAREKRMLDDLTKAKFRTFTWDAADPLADLLLIQLGAYPAKEDCPINYGATFASLLGAIEDTIPANEPLPTRIYDHPSIAYLSRHNLQRHYTIQAGWNWPGFFVGDVSSLDDLVTFWNLRATDNNLQFIDRANFARFEQLMPVFEKRILESVAHLEERRREVALWARRDNLKDAGELLKGRQLLLCGVDKGLWNGLNIKAPMMILGEASTLGVFGDSSGKPRVSFALADKPFSGDVWFHDRHLMASVSITGTRTLNAHHTFLPPYAPELNTFLGRSMILDYENIRIEPERLGLVIDAADKDAFITGISPEELFVELFKREGVSAKPSPAGLIARQLITQLGGVDGGRVFKIPGVRRLIKERGPTDSFTRNVALKTIGSADPDRPNATFRDHEGLYIEQRKEPHLTPPMAFAYLVDKGLFRIGADLVCPTCSLKGWTPLDNLKTKVTCEFCGAEFDATRQLISDKWHYRRSGLLGRERNVHGAIPVVLTLQQLYINLHALAGRMMYLPSYELEGLPGTDFKRCEVDFLLLAPGREKTEFIIGECKDRGEGIDATDMENLKRVGALLPEERFQIYYLLSKLGGFSANEITMAATLNDKYHHRVILLTADELEPYRIYERATDEFVRKSYGSSAEALADMTAHLYFDPAKNAGKAQPSGTTALRPAVTGSR
jgi:hypothetical protein